ncbi:MAG: hypothetical protein ABI947_03740 [Chloroflexota bacterium]
MDELNITVYNEGGRLHTVEGKPQEKDRKACNIQRFMIKYPDIQVVLWVVGEVPSREAYIALYETLKATRIIFAE